MKEILPPILPGEVGTGPGLSLCTFVLHPSGCTANQLVALKASSIQFFRASTGSTDLLSAILGVAPFYS